MRKIQFQDLEGNKIELSPSGAAGMQCFWLSFEFINGEHKSKPVPPTMDQLNPMVHLSFTQLAMLRNACEDMMESFEE